MIRCGFPVLESRWCPRGASMKVPPRPLVLSLVSFLLCVLALDFASAAPNPQAGSAATQSASAASADAPEGVVLPGPLRSFLRMAGISQKVAPDEVLPLLARNVVIQGYENPRDKDAKPNEFLILLKRYVAAGPGRAAHGGTFRDPARFQLCRGDAALARPRLRHSRRLRPRRGHRNRRGAAGISDGRFRIPAGRVGRRRPHRQAV